MEGDTSGMEQWITDPPLLWLLVLLVFAVVEAVTENLRTLWLSLGAGFGLLSALCSDSLMILTVVFTLASALFLVLTNPMVCRMKEQQRAESEFSLAEDVQQSEEENA